jgi:hypothetical protein
MVVVVDNCCNRHYSTVVDILADSLHSFVAELVDSRHSFVTEMYSIELFRK